MATKTNSRKKTPKVGERIVRGWFDTVINPLLQSLKWEQGRLEKKNWTWQVPPGHLESIRPIKDMISRLAEDNLEQFAKFYPVIKENMDFHDEERAQLLVACKKLQRVVEESEELEAIYQRAKSDDSMTPRGTPLNDVFGSYTEREHLELLAQCVVNQWGELPSSNIYAPVWNKYQAEFLALLNLPAIKPQKELTERAGKKLLQTVQHLIALLKETREQLSLKYDVPYVTAATIYGE
jgi:hypothetical protein